MIGWGHYLVMNKAAIHIVHVVQSLVDMCGYKATYFLPYSPFLKLVE